MLYLEHPRHETFGLEPVAIDTGIAVRQRRRADQRHRVQGLARMILNGEFGAGAMVARQQVENGAQMSTSTWTRPCSTQAGMVRSEPDRERARHRRRAGDDRFQQERDRGRPALVRRAGVSSIGSR